MQRRFARGAAIALLSTPIPTAAQAQAACDRQCLADGMTAFLDAVVAHDPKAAPPAAKLRFAEDTAVMTVGEAGSTSGAARSGVPPTRVSR